eukprot:1178192-Prorocentrum_minimum.AAC.1
MPNAGDVIMVITLHVVCWREAICGPRAAAANGRDTVVPPGLRVSPPGLMWCACTGQSGVAAAPGGR